MLLAYSYTLLHTLVHSCILLHTLAYSSYSCTLLHTLTHSCILLHTLAYSCTLLHTLAHSYTLAYSCILLHTLVHPCILLHILAYSYTHTCYYYYYITLRHTYQCTSLQLHDWSVESRHSLGYNRMSLHNTQITVMQTCNSTGSQLAYGLFQRQNKNVDRSEVHLEKEERERVGSEGGRGRGRR